MQTHLTPHIVNQNFVVIYGKKYFIELDPEIISCHCREQILRVYDSSAVRLLALASRPTTTR